jgi:hypothetical protein
LQSLVRAALRSRFSRCHLRHHKPSLSLTKRPSRPAEQTSLRAWLRERFGIFDIVVRLHLVMEKTEWSMLLLRTVRTARTHQGSARRRAGCCSDRICVRKMFERFCMRCVVRESTANGAIVLPLTSPAGSPSIPLSMVMLETRCKQRIRSCAAPACCWWSLHSRWVTPSPPDASRCRLL